VYLSISNDAVVTRDEIRAYYDEHIEDYRISEDETVPLLEVEDEITDILMKQARDRLYAAWLEDARSRADVQVAVEDWWRQL
jgi:hypothetical protein